MGLISVNSFGHELRKDAALIGIGAMIGMYLGYSIGSKLVEAEYESKNKNVYLELKENIHKVYHGKLEIILGDKNGR